MNFAQFTRQVKDSTSLSIYCAELQQSYCRWIAPSLDKDCYLIIAHDETQPDLKIKPSAELELIKQSALEFRFKVFEETEAKHLTLTVNVFYEREL